MSLAARWPYLLALLLGYLYIALIPFKPYPLGWLLKPLPMLLFAWLVWRDYPGAAGRWLGLGFVAAAAGDFFLDYGNRDGLFVQALLAFLLNQLAFVAGFLLLGRGRPWRWWWSLPVIAYAIGMTLWMLPGAGALHPGRAGQSPGQPGATGAGLELGGARPTDACLLGRGQHAAGAETAGRAPEAVAQLPAPPLPAGAGRL